MFSRVISIIGRIYRGVVPLRIRTVLFRKRRQWREDLYELRWRLLPEAYMRRWTDKRLELGPFYWLFIMGCNNSGTTLLRKILESHPDIRSLPVEGQVLTRAIPRSTGPRFGRVFTQMNDQIRWTEDSDNRCVPRVRYDWANRFPGKPPGVLLEKSPPNSVRSRWLQRNFSPARFITLVRNPYAVCEGINRRDMHSIEEAAVHWKCVYDILETDNAYLEKNLFVRYEDICDRPEETVKRIEDFLELTPFDWNILNDAIKVHNMDDEARTIANYYERSIERLTEEDIRMITDVLGEKMTEFGYEPISR
jgi:hypothetical protein